MPFSVFIPGFILELNLMPFFLRVSFKLGGSSR